MQDFSAGGFVLVGEGEGQRAIVGKFVHAMAGTGNAELVADLARAVKTAEQEGLRNVMIATCKELRLWPPLSEDRLESIAYSDTSEPLDAIAWALYNYDKCIDRASHDQTCRTASFLVDFGHASGQLDGVGTSKAGSKLLTDFLSQATQWTNERAGIRELVLGKLAEFADPQFISEIETWLDKHWEAVAVGSVALVVGFVLAAIAIQSSKK